MDEDFDLTANTGKNDPTSVWGSGLLSNVVNLAGQGAGIYKQLTTSGNTAGPVLAKPPTVVPQATPAWKQYLPWAIGAVALIVVVGFLFRRR